MPRKPATMPPKRRRSEFPAEPVTKTAKRDHFVATIAHEINNPLTAVLANASFLREILRELEGEHPSPRYDDARECLDDLQAAGARIRDYVRELRQTPGGAVAQGQPKGEMHVDAQARVLVIDDDANVAKAVTRIFRDHDVTALLDARQALALIRDGARFDAIICDVVMPDLSGPALYEIVEDEVPQQAARFVFITGGPTSVESEAFVRRMRHRVAFKPFERPQLLALVDAVLPKR